MTESEIQQRYAGRWVLIEYRRLGDDFEVTDGDVLIDAASKEEVYKALLRIDPGKNTAIQYCGDWPTDTAVMFCAQLLR